MCRVESSARGSSSTPRDAEINNLVEAALLKAEVERLKAQVAQGSARKASGLALPPVAAGIDTRLIRTAGLCRRFMARLLDQLILIPTALLICYLLPRPTVGVNFFGVEKMEFAVALTTPLYQLVQLLVQLSVRLNKFFRVWSSLASWNRQGHSPIPTHSPTQSSSVTSSSV